MRKRIKLAPEQAIFVFINNYLPPTGEFDAARSQTAALLTHDFVAASLMSAIYETHKSPDGFLYVTYSGENTFGGEELTE